MKKISKKILCSLIAMVFVLAQIPSFALWAVNAEGGAQQIDEQTDFTGYTEISTKEELNAVRNDLSGKYVMTADIVFTEEDFAEGGDFYNDGQGWEPIGARTKSPFHSGGREGNEFVGIFDGNGHTIKGLKINIKSDTNVFAGLFGCIYGGTVKNLGMIDSFIEVEGNNYTGFAYIGGVAGCAYPSGSEITNCFNTGYIASEQFGVVAIGGIVGLGSEITNCFNSGNITATAKEISNAGGIAGDFDIIINCKNSGTVTANVTLEIMDTHRFFGSHAGGIAGGTHGGWALQITNCNNTGTVIATSKALRAHAGGIFGFTYDTDTTIENCYNTGSVTATTDSQGFAPLAFAGGILAWHRPSDEGSKVTINSCYNIGDVTASSKGDHAQSKAGGILGRISRGSVTNCFNAGNVFANAVDIGNGGAEAYCGGIAGDSTTEITNCYNIGNTVASVSTSSQFYSDTYIGGIAGITTKAVTNSYYLDTLSVGVGDGTDTAVSCTDNEMKKQATFVGFDFDEIWTMDGDSDYLYPKLIELLPDVKYDYKITYNANYEGADPATVEDSENKLGITDTKYSITVDENVFTRDGYILDGWAKKPTGSIVCGGGDVMSFTEGGSITLYAVWVAKDTTADDTTETETTTADETTSDDTTSEADTTTDADTTTEADTTTDVDTTETTTSVTTTSYDTTTDTITTQEASESVTETTPVSPDAGDNFGILILTFIPIVLSLTVIFFSKNKKERCQ